MKSADIERFSRGYAAGEPTEGRLARALQVDVPVWRELGNEILADLDEHVFGVRWWAPHPGASRRILVSDHLFTSVRNVESNLIEARLHLIEAIDFWERESDFHARAVSITTDGRINVQLPERRCPLDDLRPAMSMLHTVGFIRAVAGALDCFGASVVGVVALKTSLLRADLDSARRALAQVAGASTVEPALLVEEVRGVLRGVAAQAGAGADREKMVENWIRAARMSKDGIVTALEQGFQWWERQVREQVRRTASAAGAGSEKKHANPMEAWAENWRKATESFNASGDWTEAARKQAESVQKTLQDGLRAWQRMWEPEKKEKKES